MKPLGAPDPQSLLRAIALWAADCAEAALPIFERHHPHDTRPREALAAARAFGHGKPRDKQLRKISMAAFRAAQGEPVAQYAARAASLAAAVAYTHTDLTTGIQGVRQARHVLGPAVYAALALEADGGGDAAIGDAVIRQFSGRAPEDLRTLLAQMPPQPSGKKREDRLFAELDAVLRGV